MSIFEMYAEMEKGITEEKEKIYFEGLQALAEMELYEETKPYCDKYDAIMEGNYARKNKGNARHNSISKDKAKRLAKAQRKANHRLVDRHGDLDNGHYYLSMSNNRGYYNTVIIEKKANRKRKRSLLGSMDYEIALS